MKRLTLLLVMAVSAIGCRHALKGRIEERGGTYYLINTSPNTAYQFTVHETKITNDSIYSYQTWTEKLAPGEEKYIYVKTEKTPLEYELIEDPFVKYGGVLIKDDKPKFDSNKSFVEVTEKSFAIVDSTKPLPQTTYRYKYKVTGELLLKNDIKYSSKDVSNEVE